jgi:hypothetical protein
MHSHAKAEHGGPIRRLPFASKIGQKSKVRKRSPTWIAHDFSKNIQIIANDALNHQLKSVFRPLASNFQVPIVVLCSWSFLKGQLNFPARKLPQQVDDGGAL